MVKVFQTSSSKGIKSKSSRGIKIRQYFDIHLNWYCHQSPGIFQPRLALLHASQICFAGTNTCVPMGWITARCPQERLSGYIRLAACFPAVLGHLHLLMALLWSRAGAMVALVGVLGPGWQRQLFSATLNTEPR